MRPRRLLLAAVLAVLAFALPVPAHAATTYWYWEGGCGYDTVSGTVTLKAVLLHDLAPTPGTVHCVLVVDATRTTVLGPDHTDTGVVVDAGPLSFTAGDVALCTVVSFDQEPSHTAFEHCVDPVGDVPPPVLILIDTVNDVVNDAIDSVNVVIDECRATADPCPVDAPYYLFYYLVDPLVCPLLGQVPSVPPLLYTDPYGDTWIGGNSPSDKVWDCPPYDWW